MHNEYQRGNLHAPRQRQETTKIYFKIEEADGKYSVKTIEISTLLYQN